MKKCYLVYRIEEHGFGEERFPLCVFLSENAAKDYVDRLGGYIFIEELDFYD